MSTVRYELRHIQKTTTNLQSLLRLTTTRSMLFSSKITVQAFPEVSRFLRTTEINLKSAGIKNLQKSRMTRTKRKMNLLSTRTRF